MAELIRHGREGRRTTWPRWWWIVGGLCLAAAGAAVALVYLVHADSRNQGERAAPGAPPATSALAECTATDTENALRDFVRAWNRRDDHDLSKLLAAHAELDMSTERQRALPPARGGGYTSNEGTEAILRFVHARWRLGERLSFERAAPFPGGVVAVGMLAHFRDGRFQPMVEAKFARDCPRKSFKHIVIGAGEVAR